MQIISTDDHDDDLFLPLGLSCSRPTNLAQTVMRQPRARKKYQASVLGNTQPTVVYRVLYSKHKEGIYYRGTM